MREVALESALELLIDHRGKTPKKLGGDFTESGVRVVSAIHIKNGRINWEERSRYVSEDMYEKWMPQKTRKGDVLLTSEAPLGEVAQVADDEPLVLSQRLFGLRGKAGMLDSSYLRYFLQSELGQRRLLAHQSGSTVSGIRQALLRKVKIPLPPLPEQERIAGVLGAFDDLIETNMTLASQLDSILFAHVGAAAEGASAVSFGEVATRVTDKVASQEMQEGQTYLGLEHFGADGVGLIGRGTTDAVSSTSSAFRKGDVLYGKLRPYFRKVARPGFDGVCSAEAWVLRAKGGHSQAVLHTIAHSQAFSDAAVAGSGGTRMPRADWKHLSSLQVPDLRQVLGEREEAALDSLWQAACDLREETDELTQQRDELLPLLMSGKVRVSELEGVA